MKISEIARTTIGMPDGWFKIIYKRIGGRRDGFLFCRAVSPQGYMIRSKPDLKEYLKEFNIKDVTESQISFSVPNEALPKELRKVKEKTREEAARPKELRKLKDKTREEKTHPQELRKVKERAREEEARPKELRKIKEKIREEKARPKELRKGKEKAKEEKTRPKELRKVKARPRIPFKRKTRDELEEVLEETTEGLPRGWRKLVVRRRTGTANERVDVYALPPNGPRLPSRYHVRQYLKRKGITDIDPESVSFSRYDTPVRSRYTPNGVMRIPHNRVNRGEKAGVPKNSGPSTQKKEHPSITPKHPPGKLRKRKIRGKTEPSKSTTKSKEPEEPRNEGIIENRRSKRKLGEDPKAASESKKSRNDQEDVEVKVDPMEIKPDVIPDAEKKAESISASKNPSSVEVSEFLEKYAGDDWKLLVAASFLEVSASHEVISLFFSSFPTPKQVNEQGWSAVSEVLEPFGLDDGFAKLLARLTYDLTVEKSSVPNFRVPEDLSEVSKFVSDCYRAFHSDKV